MISKYLKKKKVKNHSNQSFHPIFKMLASKYSENHDLKVEQIKMAKKKGNGGVKITKTSNFGFFGGFLAKNDFFLTFFFFFFFS